MQHLTEQELVLHHYHDDDAPTPVERHLASCDDCRREYGAIRRVLTLVQEMPVPERGETYGEQVWSRLRWRLGSERRRRRTWQSMLAAAAVLAVAFFAGQLWQARSGAQRRVAAGVPAGRVAGETPAATKERILLVVVTDHLDSSERMLLAVANADAKRTLDMSADHERAEELVASNRMFRQTATQRGDERLAAVLADIEPVLLEIAHADEKLSSEEVSALQKRIDSRGLLFKVRVVSAQASGRKAPALQKGMSSL